MSAAGDRREALEALLWRNRIAAPLVAEILAAADRYARASAPRPAGPRKPPKHRKGPALHYAPADQAQPACRPFDRISSLSWAVTSDPQEVTCGHCLKVLGPPKTGGAS
jgi:hypothetical protein